MTDIRRGDEVIEPPPTDGEYFIEFERTPKPLLCEVLHFEDHVEVLLPHRHRWTRWEKLPVKRYRKFNSFEFIEGATS